MFKGKMTLYRHTLAHHEQKCVFKPTNNNMKFDIRIMVIIYKDYTK